MPGVVRYHRDEYEARSRRVRLPRCGFCGFSPRVEITDDPNDRTVTAPGTFGGGGTPSL